MEEQRLNAYKIFNSMYTPVLYSNKTCATTKETISKVKRQLSEWEKIIANDKTDKGLISKIYKQLMQLKSRK